MFEENKKGQPYLVTTHYLKQDKIYFFKYIKDYAITIVLQTGVSRFRQGILKFCGRVQVGLHGPGKKEPKTQLLNLTITAMLLLLN